MKKTYIAPSLVMVKIAPISVDGSQALAKENDAWDIWDEE